MNEQAFANQINRLAETYGKNAYSNERVKLIWAGVRNLSQEWLKSTVDAMIGNMRQAPMIPDFIEAARMEFNRNHEQAKSHERVNAKEWVSNFSTEDEKMMAGMIVRRMNKGVSEPDWENFLRMLDGMAAAERFKPKGMV